MKDFYRGAIIGTIGVILSQIIFKQGFDSYQERIFTIGGNILIGAIVGGIVVYLFAKIKNRD